MDRRETARALAILRAAYPNFYRGMNKQELDGIVDLWASMFEDDPAVYVEAAVKALIATDEKGFPPHIGAVKAKLRQITTPEMMSEQEAWNLILRAITNSGYNSQKEYDALPPLLQSLVGSPRQLRDWGMMDETTVQSVVASNFMRSYRARAQHQREFDALPSDVKALAHQLSGALSMNRLALDDGGDAQ